MADADDMSLAWLKTWKVRRASIFKDVGKDSSGCAPSAAEKSIAAESSAAVCSLTTRVKWLVHCQHGGLGDVIREVCAADRC